MTPDNVQARRTVKLIFKIIAIVFILQFTLAGAVLLFMSYLMGMNAEQIRENGGQEIVAVIRELEYDHHMDSNAAYVEYKLNDQVYMNKLDFYSSDFKVGQEVTIVCNRDNPNDIACVTEVPDILRTIGTILVVVSVVAILIIVFGKLLLFLIMRKTMGG